MKKLIIIASLVATVGVNFSCSDSFFAIEPQGAASLTSLSNKNGVNALLIGAYSLMDGVGAGNTGRQSTISNYVFGGITSGDAVKGTDIGDQPEQEYIEQFNWLSDNTYFLGKWQHSYDGVARANEALMPFILSIVALSFFPIALRNTSASPFEKLANFCESNITCS